MPRLIDAEPLRAKLTWLNEYDYLHVLNDIKSLPTVDAEPIVQCKDCKQFVETNALYDGECPKLRVYVNKDYYCWWGERKDDAETN